MRLNKVSKDQAGDVLNDSYIKIHEQKIKVPELNINKNYILITCKNLILAERNKEPLSELDSNIVADCQSINHEKLDNIIYNEINTSNFDYIEEAVLKVRIFSPDTTQKELENITGLNTSKLQRKHKAAVTKLKKIVIEKYGNDISDYWIGID